MAAANYGCCLPLMIIAVSFCSSTSFISGSKLLSVWSLFLSGSSVGIMWGAYSHNRSRAELGVDLRRFHSSLCFWSTSDRTLETDLQPPKCVECESLVRSASDTPSDVRAFASLKQNSSDDLPRTFDSSTNEIVFHGLPSKAYSFPVSYLDHYKLEFVFDFATIFTKKTAQSCVENRGDWQWKIQ